MRTKWLNLILHTSSLIQRIKDSLFISHGLGSVVRVVALIFVSFFFVIVSTPFTLLVKDGKEDKELRRLLSFSFLIPTTVLWIVKLLFVVFFVFVMGYSWFEVESTREVVDSTSTRIYSLGEGDFVNISDIRISFDTFPTYSLNIEGAIGRGDYDSVLVVLSSEDDVYTRYLLDGVEDDGGWVISKDFNTGDVPDGEYSVSVAGVDSDEGVRSPFIDAGAVTFEEPLWFSVLQSLDVYLNSLIIVFIGVSIFLTLILI